MNLCLIGVGGTIMIYRDQIAEGWRERDRAATRMGFQRSARSFFFPAITLIIFSTVSISGSFLIAFLVSIGTLSLSLSLSLYHQSHFWFQMPPSPPPAPGVSFRHKAVSPIFPPFFSSSLSISYFLSPPQTVRWTSR